MPAQDNRAPAQRGAPNARIAVAQPPAAVEEISQELESLLQKWEVESSKIKSLHGTQSRSEINRVFNVEKVSRGRFFLEMPDKGRIDMLSVKLGKNDLSQWKDPDGKSFKLETGRSEIWICDGDAILMLDEDEKTFQKEEIPPDQRGKNIVHSPLPFLFGMKAEEAKARYKLTLKREDKDIAVLLAEPRMAKDRQNYKIAQIKLSKKKYLPEEVRLMDQAKQETIYRFDDVVINERDIAGLMPKMFKGDPYRPSLKGYTKVIPPEDPIEAQEKHIKQATERVPAAKDAQRTSRADDPVGRSRMPDPKAAAPRTNPGRN